MQRFLKNTIFFALLIILMSGTYEYLLRGVPNTYKIKKQYLDTHSGNIKVLAIGSSHIFYGINPDYLTMSGYNAAQVAQPFYYDNEILEKYVGKWDSLKYIILAVDYFSFYAAPFGEDTRKKNYFIYYDIKKSNNLLEHLEVFNNRPENYERLFNYYVKRISPITTTEKGMGTEYKAKDSKNLEISGRIAAARHLAANDQYFNNNLTNLYSIVKFAKVNNKKLIMLTLPAYHTYTSRLDKKQLNPTLNAINKIGLTNSHTYFFNFLNDSTFEENDFYDADHLNNIGAEKFTKKLDSILLKLDLQNEK